MNQQEQIFESDLISRDLSWIQFNHRVLDQAKKPNRSIVEKLKFLAITASNADEFFMIRIGSLYNYIDYESDRVDYSGLHLHPFKEKLLSESKAFSQQQSDLFLELKPHFKDHQFDILSYDRLSKSQKEVVDEYFNLTIFPMLTPMAFDSYHTFPVLVNKVLVFGVVTEPHNNKDLRRMSFIQIPQNLPRFYELKGTDGPLFIPIEKVIGAHLDKLFKNVSIISTTLFRVTRNGDFTLDESEDVEANFLEELRKKLKTRRTGRVVKVEVEEGGDGWLIDQLLKRYEVTDENVEYTSGESLIDFTGLWQIVGHSALSAYHPAKKRSVPPLSMTDMENQDMFKLLGEQDVLLHHPYNSIEPLLDLLDQAADDPDVLSIKLTIYRLAKESRVVEALHRAAENGKHVSVLFEVKARFDEENNMREARKLQKAGCFVIYGVGSLKTHTKLLLIVRNEGNKVGRYVHMSSGNYNEDTSRLYTDISLLTSKDAYANDIQEFFNVITGHSEPSSYESLITAPNHMRDTLIQLINQEAENARKGLRSGIVIKINSLQDKDSIYALYDASQAGVPIHLIIRGICCLRPGRTGLSENIKVRSIVGDFLEHSRIYYFQNQDNPRVYSGSADMMVRSFDRRLESLFMVKDNLLRQQLINILHFNLRDNLNAYEMLEDGTYDPVHQEDKDSFNIHEAFFHVKKEEVMKVTLF